MGELRGCVGGGVCGCGGGGRVCDWGGCVKGGVMWV